MKKQHLIIIILLALLIPGALLAQNVLTPEGLAEQLSAVKIQIGVLDTTLQRADEQIRDMDHRVRAIEQRHREINRHPLKSRINSNADVGCEIGSHDGFSTNKMHPDTYINFLQNFSAQPHSAQLLDIYYYSQTMTFEINYKIIYENYEGHIIASELWEGCRFLATNFQIVENEE